MKRLIPIFFLTLLLLYFPLTLAQPISIEVDWKYLTSQLLPVSENFKWIFIALGFPEELIQSWVTISLYILFPLFLFSVVVHDVVFTGLETTLFPTLQRKPWVGWLLSVFMVLALVPLGVVGPFLLWVYLNAAAFAVYGVGIILILSVINRFISVVTREKLLGGKGSRLLILTIILILFFFPSLYGVFLSIGVYTLLLLLLAYTPLKKITKPKSPEEEYKKILREENLIKDIRELYPCIEEGGKIAVARSMLGKIKKERVRDSLTALGFYSEDIKELETYLTRYKDLDKIKEKEETKKQLKIILEQLGNLLRIRLEKRKTC